MFRTRTYASCVQSAPVTACAVVMHTGDIRGAGGRREGYTGERHRRAKRSAEDPAARQLRGRYQVW